MSTSDQIEEILYEASAYGLRDEVINSAKELITFNPGMDIVQAYEIAYQDWIK